MIDWPFVYHCTTPASTLPTPSVTISEFTPDPGHGVAVAEPDERADEHGDEDGEPDGPARSRP